MSKEVSMMDNGVGGVDLLTTSAANHIRILTGYKEHSVDFWTRLREKCDEALDYMEK